MTLFEIPERHPDARTTTVREHTRKVREPRTRTTDPQTSVDAAASLTGIAKRQALILEAFETRGAMTADEVVRAMPDDVHPPTIHSAVARLGKAGCLVKVGIGVSDRGNPMTIWRAA